ncbi:Permease of the drug/metabolite transporter (DMT) superfamily [Bosea lathyri]|jgi:drug/metabolite transporter (DMT)-like permease|uniref:Permease of the drug/metabolite transporter (DMT) superfamily n=1 Tax=Bosea lathyri TaxID=1036778 RepID=A0A1H6AWZ6_9HYPH|nr:Permease of the drug/metabolite transporter (DMT) superfamily [Bosea lathyri]
MTGTVLPAQSPHAPDEGRSRLVAIGLMCVAVICFSLLDTSAKWLGGSMDPLQVVLARYAGSMAMVLALFNPWSRPGVLRTKRPWLQAGRSLLLLGSTALNFIALQYLQLAETVSIMFATPLLVALVSGPMLGEWPGPRRLAAIAVGFIGVLVITRPGFGGMHPAALLSVIGCFCYAFYSLSTRVLSAYDSSETTMIYSGVAGTLVMLPLLPWIWTTPQTPLPWLLMLATGALGGFGHWLLILAHRLAPATVLAPFIYSQIIWMIALGYLVFGQLPDRWTFIGTAIVIASGLYLLYRERVRHVPEDAASARLD